MTSRHPRVGWSRRVARIAQLTATLGGLALAACGSSKKADAGAGDAAVAAADANTDAGPEDLCLHSCPAVILSTSIEIDGPLDLSIEGGRRSPDSLRVDVCLDDACLPLMRAPGLDAQVASFCGDAGADCTAAAFAVSEANAFSDLSRLVMVHRADGDRLSGRIYMPLARDAGVAAQTVTVSVSTDAGLLISRQEAHACVLRTTGCCVPSQLCPVTWP